MATLPQETFRLYPVKGHQAFFIVHVAPTLRLMRRVMRSHVGCAHPQQMACCWAVSVDKKHPKAQEHEGLIGVLFFAAEALGVGIVSHEMAHAGFRMLEHQKIRLRHWIPRENDGKVWADASHPEEHYATIVEEMNVQFWREVRKRSIIKED